jgi:hypothetical protein
MTVKRALPFVRSVHRRLPVVQGAMWATSTWVGPELVGVALVGHPARELMVDDTLAVLRVAVIEGNRNACSMLYGACSRAARAMGARNLVTYLHEDETGTSLKAAGWIYDGVTTGGEHSRPSRPRAAAVDPAPKQRWWAPWSERVHKRKGRMMSEKFTPADAAGTPNEEEAYPMVACPVCAVEQQDLDGFGVLHCFACGYCSHPSRDGGVCGLCGHREYEAGDAGGSEDRDWFARQAARTAEDIKQLPDWLKTPKDAAGTPRE